MHEQITDGIIGRLVQMKAQQKNVEKDQEKIKVQYLKSKWRETGALRYV